jgi:DNA-binding LacI/PurR family transcriptional regulator
MSNLETIAKLAGVSIATASQALRGWPDIAPSTRERVLRIAQELNYSPETPVSRLDSGPARTIGFILPLADQWFYSQISAAIETTMLLQNYDVLRYPVSDPVRQTEIIRRLATSHRVDGMIISTIQLTERDVDLLRHAELPVITIETRISAFSSITCNNVRGAEMATRHLIDLGHRRIGLITGLPETPLGFPVPHQRELGYERALRAHGLEVRPELCVPGNFSPAGGAEAMAQLLAVDPPPSAVFSITDEMAIGAMKTIRDAGLCIPDDISLIGFDNHDLAEFLDLTTVHQPVSQYGALAASMLLKMLQDPAGSRVESVVLPTRLIIRKTTGPRTTRREKRLQ